MTAGIGERRESPSPDVIHPMEAGWVEAILAIPPIHGRFRLN